VKTKLFAQIELAGIFSEYRLNIQEMLRLVHTSFLDLERLVATVFQGLGRTFCVASAVHLSGPGSV